MLGPTVSLAPLSGAAGVAGTGVAAGAEKGWALLLAEPSELVPPSVELPGVRGAVGSSRLPKKGP